MARKSTGRTPLIQARLDAAGRGEITFTAPERYRCKRCRGRERYVTSGSCANCARRQMRKKYAADRKLIQELRAALARG